MSVWCVFDLKFGAIESHPFVIVNASVLDVERILARCQRRNACQCFAIII